MRIVNVALGERSYEIRIGPGLLNRLGEHCRKLKFGTRCAVVTDDQVARLCAKDALRTLRSSGFDPSLITVPAGEKSKSLNRVQKCYDELAAHRLERSSFIVALGGGVVGDLAGFLAATYLRGVAFVQVPTTLLAQVDSSVGGKTGVNLKAGKNLAGAFYQPRLVLCDLDTLKTLPERELRAGMAEVIKYGIISDAALFREIERNLSKLLALDPATTGKVIARCCAIKAEVVRRDEKEGGPRAILNFGHTIGHAIEALSGYGQYLHGEAIAIGQVLAAELSRRLLGLPASDVERIRGLFERTGLPTRIRLSAAKRQKLLQAMKLDKKVRGGEIKFVLAERIAKVRVGQKVPEELIMELL